MINKDIKAIMREENLDDIYTIIWEKILHKLYTAKLYSRKREGALISTCRS
jgi:hypothetical protein